MTEAQLTDGLESWLAQPTRFRLIVLLISMPGIPIRGGAIMTEMRAFGLASVLLSLSTVLSLDALRDPGPLLRDYWRELVVMLYCAAVVVIALPVLFSLDWIQPGRLVNIFGHATGLGAWLPRRGGDPVHTPRLTARGEHFHVNQATLNVSHHLQSDRIGLRSVQDTSPR